MVWWGITDVTSQGKTSNMIRSHDENGNSDSDSSYDGDKLVEGKLYTILKTGLQPILCHVN